jgi:divinyl chlorophyllide a 8-vinyl-reductase
MMFQAIGREPRFVFAPTWFFDYIIHALEFLAKLLDYEALENATETARIGKYYAVESMLTTDPNEKYGKITMQDHYNKIAAEGQDEFTPMYVSSASFTANSQFF